MTCPVRWFCTLLAFFGLLSGCGTPTAVQPVALREAAPGSTVIYFFRPSSDAVDSRDTPTLVVDAKPVVSLGFATYSGITLTPGKHRVALVAGPSDSPNWNLVADFDLRDGTTYYVALWHQNQPARTPGHMAMYGVAGGLIVQLLNPPTGSAGVRFELVARDVAEFAVAGLRLVPPADPSMMVR